VRRQTAHACDWLPTLAELTGVKAPAVHLDGRSLVPVLRDAKASSPHEKRALHWQVGLGPKAEWAVLEGDWKLIGRSRDTGVTDGERLELFLGNLSEDPGETRDFAAEQAERVARLRQLHEAHLEQP
jgi:arylsulfatase A-like enzyme